MDLKELLSSRKAMIVGGACAAVVAGVVAAWLVWGGPPDPADQTPEEALAYMASEGFSKLSGEQQDAYLRRAREAHGGDRRRVFRDADLTDEQRDRLRRNMFDAMRRRMRERLDEFFDLSEDERDDYLDEIIDRWQDRPRRPPGRDRPAESEDADDEDADGEQDEQAEEDRPRRRGFTPERMKDRLESSDPADRARMTEFMRALRKRMDERGISRRGRR